MSAAACTDAEILHAYQEQPTTVEPGFRWIKNPAAISPVWLEKPERIAALAMRTVVGLLVYTVIQRQVRTHDTGRAAAVQIGRMTAHRQRPR
jgi:transposase